MSKLNAAADHSTPFFWTDFGFAAVFAVCFSLTVVYAFKAFKLNPQMISLPNILVMLLIQLTLISKFVVLTKIISSRRQSILPYEPRRDFQLRHSCRELGNARIAILSD